MNREAMLRILNRTRDVGPVALAGPPTPATCVTPGHSRDAVADPAPCELLTHPPDPRERLTGYLNAWAGMDEAAWPEANVRALYEDIMDIFGAFGFEAERWYREWRTAHPEARW